MIILKQMTLVFSFGHPIKESCWLNMKTSHGCPEFGTYIKIIEFDLEAFAEEYEIEENEVTSRAQLP